MLNQFSRTQLLLGQDGMDRLANARVAVFGVGGVGGFTVEALARSGVGAIDLIDDDKVCLTNINRQIIALRSTVGKYKVDVAAERLRDINQNIQVNTYKTFLYADTAHQFNFRVRLCSWMRVPSSGQAGTGHAGTQSGYADYLFHGRGQQTGSDCLPRCGYL